VWVPRGLVEWCVPFFFFVLEAIVHNLRHVGSEERCVFLCTQGGCTQVEEGSVWILKGWQKCVFVCTQRDVFAVLSVLIPATKVLHDGCAQPCFEWTRI
jgi:hypothetical protein